MPRRSKASRGAVHAVHDLLAHILAYTPPCHPPPRNAQLATQKPAATHRLRRQSREYDPGSPSSRRRRLLLLALPDIALIAAAIPTRVPVSLLGSGGGGGGGGAKRDYTQRDLLRVPPSPFGRTFASVRARQQVGLAFVAVFSGGTAVFPTTVTRGGDGDDTRGGGTHAREGLHERNRAERWEHLRDRTQGARDSLELLRLRPVSLAVRAAAETGCWKIDAASKKRRKLGSGRSDNSSIESDASPSLTQR